MRPATAAGATRCIGARRPQAAAARLVVAAASGSRDRRPDLRPAPSATASTDDDSRPRDGRSRSLGGGDVDRASGGLASSWSGDHAGPATTHAQARGRSAAARRAWSPQAAQCSGGMRRDATSRHRGWRLSTHSERRADLRRRPARSPGDRRSSRVASRRGRRSRGGRRRRRRRGRRRGRARGRPRTAARRTRARARRRGGRARRPRPAASAAISSSAAAGQLVGALEAEQAARARRSGRAWSSTRRSTRRLPRLALGGHDEQRRGLAAADVAALALGGLERGHQALGEVAARRARTPPTSPAGTVSRAIMFAWQRPVRAGRVARARDAVARRCGRRRRRAASTTPTCRTARQRVGGDQLGERVLRARRRRRMPVERVRAVRGLDDRLRGDGADARPRPRAERADGEPVRLDGRAELAGRGVERDDRVGAVAHRARISA